MTPEELRRETGTGETVPYADMWERVRQLGIGSVVGIGVFILVLYGAYRWITS